MRIKGKVKGDIYSHEGRSSERILVHVTHRHIVVCADKGISLSRCASHYSTHTKISNLDFSSMIYQQIRRLHISVYYVLLVMQIQQTLEHLHQFSCIG